MHPALALQGCLQTLQDSQTDLDKLMDRCDRVPQELAELLAHKTEHLLQVQTKLLHQLGELPRRSDELAPVIQLLNAQRSMLHATHRLLDEVCVKDHVQILRQWIWLMKTGKQALAQLPSSARVTECRDLFWNLLNRFAEAGTMDDCQIMLQLLESCLRMIASEQRQAVSREHWRHATDRVSLPAPSSTPMAQRGANVTVITLDAPPVLKPEPVPQPCTEPGSAHESGTASQRGNDTVESAYAFLNLMKQSSGGGPAISFRSDLARYREPSSPNAEPYATTKASKSHRAVADNNALVVAAQESLHAGQAVKKRRGRPVRGTEAPQQTAKPPLRKTAASSIQSGGASRTSPSDTDSGVSPTRSEMALNNAPQFSLEDFILLNTANRSTGQAAPSRYAGLITPEHAHNDESPPEILALPSAGTPPASRR